MAEALRWSMRLALVLAGLYAVLLVILFVAQRSLLYPSAGRGRLMAAIEAGLPGFEDLSIITDDGERLAAWWKRPQPGRALLVYFHGNGGMLWNRRGRARELTRDGRGLLLVSYRGYSGSTGSPTEAGLRLDALAAYEWAVKAGGGRGIVLYGESLGTGVAVRLATEREVAGLILDSPYTSTADVARTAYWFMPIGLLMLDQYRSIDRIAAVRAPILMLHGELDGVIPIALGEKLFAAAPEPKRFVRLPGIDHASVLEGGGLPPVRAFLDAVEARLAP